MSKNTIKYEYTEGCPKYMLGILSQQTYKDKEGKLNTSAYGNIRVEHEPIDLILKAVRYEKVIDDSGKVVEIRDVKTKGDDEPTH